MRRLMRYIVVVLALAIATPRLSAQELVVGADFTTLFDNTEFSPMEHYNSETLFSARLTPKIGVKWHNHNELIFGADMVQDFGHDSKFLSDVNVEMYYALKHPKAKLFAGIFPRKEMRGLRSPIYFDPAYLYYNNRIGGVLARYEANEGRSFIEFAMDYTGMRDFETRESFMIMSAGKYSVAWFKAGYDFLMGHYAKDYNPATWDGVVDNIMITPYVGGEVVAGPVDVDIQLSLVQSLQRDRIMENKWESPRGCDIYAAVSGWGVTLSNRLYVGKGLYSYYSRYGSAVYHGIPHYAISKGRGNIYNVITASYSKLFCDDSIGLDAGITMEYDGKGWGTRQWLKVSVMLDYGIDLKKDK